MKQTVLYYLLHVYDDHETHEIFETEQQRYLFPCISQ